ncbi:MAG: FAD-dependent oxidoreductase [Cytophagia bacterium]|nr:FAD-dependent oxidoreductase [Cytophagia bacterium]
MKKSDVLIIGSGLGSLTSAVLLAKKGLKVRIIEQNWQAGGCTGSYWRKGYVFETGATTLVGLGKGLPLQYLLDQIGVEIEAKKLNLPMQVRLKNGSLLNRFEELEAWIAEAERVFGKVGQRQFWEECYSISQFVWKNSLSQLSFPPRKAKDFTKAIKSVSFEQLANLKNAFLSVESLLRKYNLHDNQPFCDFVNEQLLITAQNHKEEVNALFGATALCYTNYPNYYVNGGLINLVKPLIEFLTNHGGEIVFREEVSKIDSKGGSYVTSTQKADYESEFVISGIPFNNTLEVFQSDKVHSLKPKVLSSEQLNSAFQLGIGFIPHKEFDSIHHQIHLSEPLPEIGSASIFVSLNHPEDNSRTDEEGHAVMSVSTHIPDPANRVIDGQKVEGAIIDELIRQGFLLRENIKLVHSSSPGSWTKWTGRKWGFVGGYPQFKKIKPWQMLDARLDNHKAYQVGDTVYPGQGIPGVTLSGIIAVEKMELDWDI